MSTSPTSFGINVSNTADTSSDSHSIGARIDRLPAVATLWKLTALIAIGGFFELFDLFQTAYISPGLLEAGIFSRGSEGLFGFSDQAAFGAATFLGLFIGAVLISPMADRFGRRSIFAYALLWYTLLSVLMALQSTSAGVMSCRLLVGIGLGVELVTIDTYLSELMPKRMRGSAFAFAFFIQFLAVPAVALLSWLLVPHSPFNIAGWRWVILIGAACALLMWRLRRTLPESPRWLANHGQSEEAARVVSDIERRCEKEYGQPLPPIEAPAKVPPHASQQPSMWQPPYRKRMLMLITFNIFQAIGFFGFGNWLPALLGGQGSATTHSLLYAFFITLAYPLGSLVMMKAANRLENKWQIVASSLGTVIFGSLFALASAPWALIVSGLAITLCNSWMTYAFHAYQAELFPTAIRARAVGFCYSFSRLSTVFSSVLIGFILDNLGASSVLVFIITSMLIVVLTIALFGPRTQGVALEHINQ
ncbi:MFS transporter [Carnimonas nigrificans]|uniref:MFS transporter n=1 Tax=Carnimonas nigrificans TaxID=64323 RepID=UPI000470364E|nr:MFS transporter [Carnimonas nigrificans]